MAEQQGMDAYTYLYPVMTAQTFEEIKANIAEITPLSTETLTSDTLVTLFDLAQTFNQQAK